jgi:hypothetical protein
MEWAGEEKTEGLGLIGRRGNLPRRCPNTVHRSNSNAEGNSHFPNAASPYDWRLNVLLRQHAEPISERCASEFGQPRVEVFVGREYGGRKMKFNSSDWYKSKNTASDLYNRSDAVSRERASPVRKRYSL